MKKIIAATLVTLLMISALGISVFASVSYFGYGATVVAGGVNMVKTGLLGKKLCFSDADFKSMLCLAEFESITVTKLPPSSEGTLLLAGRRVTEGRVIKQKNLGALVFVPSSSELTESSFRFKVNGGSGVEHECIMKFIGKVNYAPKIDSDAVSSEAVRTQENITVYSRLQAEDPEGDKLEYIIVSYPKRGSIELVDKASGKYAYTPDADYTGKDSFIYVARDEFGNYSSPLKVTLRVNERMCDTVYADMEKREEYNAAVAMTAMGIMGGRVLGDSLYFMPDEEISRAEFVSLVMKSSGIRADSTLKKTYFDDDSEIPTALKGYVATAERLGFIGGDFVDGRLLFSPNEKITKYEAAKIMAAILGADENAEESVFDEDESIPVWARAGVSCMHSIGVFDEEDVLESTSSVTRADVAEYLYRLSFLG